MSENGFPKFTKNQAYYAGRAFTEIGTCKNCFWWIEPGRCQLVTEKGDPTPGVIAAEGVCGMWNALPPRVLAYRVAWGRGEGKKGVLPGVIIKDVVMKKRRELEAKGSKRRY